MYNEKSQIKDYIQNLILMDLMMGEMIHQLDNVVIEEAQNDEENHF